MKISKIFHWLYLSIMVLPLLVIPIFAINIINRSPEPISVVVGSQVTKTYHQNQLIYNSLPTSPIGDNWCMTEEFAGDTISYYQSTNSAHIPYLKVTQGQPGYFEDDKLEYDFPNGITFKPFDVLLFRARIYVIGNSGTAQCYCSMYGYDDVNGVEFEYFGEKFNPTRSANINNMNPTSFNIEQYFILSDNNFNKPMTTYDWDCYVRLYFHLDYNFNEYYFTHIQLINLSQMFNGEIDSEILNDYLGTGLNNIDFAIDNPVTEVVSDTTITYNDTDIGSQFLYTTYHVTNKYFNFSEVPILNDFGDWFANDVFNNDVPLACYIIYDFACYWLLISIFWLMFDVMIYVPLLIHHYLDKAEVS